MDGSTSYEREEPLALTNQRTTTESERTELRGAGRDERAALGQLLAQLAERAGAESGAVVGEIAVPFRATGQTVAEVTTAAVSAVLEQQETHALLISRVDLDGWLTTADGIQAWGVLTGIPDASPPSGHYDDLAAPPAVTTEPGGVTISVVLSSRDEQVA